MSNQDQVNPALSAFFVCGVVVMIILICLVVLQNREEKRLDNLLKLLIYEEKGEVVKWQIIKKGKLREPTVGPFGETEEWTTVIRIEYFDALGNRCVEHRICDMAVLLVSEITDLEKTKEFYNCEQKVIKK